MFPLAYCDEHASQLYPQEIEELRALKRLVIEWAEAPRPHEMQHYAHDDIYRNATLALRKAVGR